MQLIAYTGCGCKLGASPLQFPPPSRTFPRAVGLVEDHSCQKHDAPQPCLLRASVTSFHSLWGGSRMWTIRICVFHCNQWNSDKLKTPHLRLWSRPCAGAGHKGPLRRRRRGRTAPTPLRRRLPPASPELSEGLAPPALGPGVALPWHCLGCPKGRREVLGIAGEEQSQGLSPSLLFARHGLRAV